MTLTQAELDALRAQLSCGFEQLDTAFAGCMEDAHHRLSALGVKRYLEGASRICHVGRGFEPVLVYLETMPTVAEALGEEILDTISQAVWDMSRTPNGQAILAFLQSVGTAARRLGTQEQMEAYITVVFDMMNATTVSIHGHHATIPSPGLVEMLNQMPFLLSRLSLEGLKNWSTYGSLHFLNNPDRQRDYFAVQAADSKAIFARERHGTLFADVQRKLELYMQALWAENVQFIPYSMGFDELRKPQAYFDQLGVHLPDVYDDFESAPGAGVSGIDRYRALLTHIAAHRRWSTAIFADNLSPFQRVAAEMFEDVRVEYLAMRFYPGLRAVFKRLHPKPIEDDCDPDVESCIRHRLTMFSYAVLDDEHPYKNEDINEYVKRFHNLMAKGEGSTREIAELAISFVARTRRQQDQSANMYFADTEIDYRDDNRNLWKFHDLGDEEETLPQQDKATSDAPDDEQGGLPPRHYPEWDDHSQTYRPDWVSLYESLHPSGDVEVIDKILIKHAVLAKRLKQLLESLKPQHYVRERYQEDGAELDLDVAVRSLIDFRAGATPDPRINMSHRTDGRNIAVSLLMDLSQSGAQTAQGCDQSVLEISLEAVSLLGWSIDRLGDEFAIAGFSSNTRHEVRYQHIKGYGENWGDEVKGRLAAIEAGYSTRMGAALRHCGHMLAQRKADKKLLLVLSDGEPSDIDVDDEEYLIKDAHKAVLELDQRGVYTHCINLDRTADSYVAEIFGTRYSVVDRVARLPEKLPQLFMALTK